MSHTNYLGSPLNANTLLYPKWERAFKDNPVRFDFLAGTGLSGTLALSALRIKYNHNIVIVRRDPENYKDWKPITEDTFGWDSPEKQYMKWLLVDDCIGSGNTFRKVWRTVRTEYRNSICVGAFLWDWDRIIDRSNLRSYLDSDKDYNSYDLETEYLERSRSLQVPSFRQTKASVGDPNLFLKATQELK